MRETVVKVVRLASGIRGLMDVLMMAEAGYMEECSLRSRGGFRACEDILIRGRIILTRMPGLRHEIVWPSGDGQRMVMVGSKMSHGPRT